MTNGEMRSWLLAVGILPVWYLLYRYLLGGLSSLGKTGLLQRGRSPIWTFPTAAGPPVTGQPSPFTRRTRLSPVHPFTYSNSNYNAENSLCIAVVYASITGRLCFRTFPAVAVSGSRATLGEETQVEILYNPQQQPSRFILKANSTAFGSRRIFIGITIALILFLYNAYKHMFMR